MKGKKVDLGSSVCAIARSLNVIGDWWSLLIIRDALAGVRRFGEFQKKLGLARNILSARLRKLVEAGIMETAPASDGGAYNEYLLTEKGGATLSGLGLTVAVGEKYSFLQNEQRLLMVDKANSLKLAPLELRTQDGRLVGPRDYTSRPIGNA